MAASVQDCGALIDSARQSGCSLAVGFHQRFRNNNKVARSLLQSGALGDVQAAQVSMISSMEPVLADAGFEGSWDWWLDPRSVGDILNTGPHAVDLLRWLLSSDIHAVAALCRTFRPSAKVEDTTVALLALENGAVCNFISSSIAPDPGFPGEQFRFRLIGSKAVMDLDPYGDLRLSGGAACKTVAMQCTRYQHSTSLLDSVRMEAFCAQMEAFATMIERKPSHIRSGHHGRTSVEL